MTTTKETKSTEDSAVAPANGADAILNEVKGPQGHPASSKTKKSINAKNFPALPQWLRKALASPPRSGEGVHNWIYKMAHKLRPYLSGKDICALLAECVRDCGRAVPEKEIRDAVISAKANPGKPSGKGQPSTPKRPKPNQEQREAVLAEMKGYGLEKFCESSPDLCGGKPMTNELLVKLFPSDCLLCAGMALNWATTKPLAEWLAEDMSAYQFIVPSPMKALTGLNKVGKVSPRCNDNTGPRRFLDVEFDNGTTDEQAAIIGWLARQAPLVIALFSGGKSLHAWFNVANAPQAKQESFFKRACQLGCDPITWTPSQFVRMPDGTRYDSATGSTTRQCVCFFNPNNLTK